MKKYFFKFSKPTNCLLFLFPSVWGAPVGGVPTGPKVFLAEHVWAAALRPDPLLKKPCAVLVQWWNGE